MGKVFNRLVSEKLIEEWALTLDWLFDDLKFSNDRNWNRGYTSFFTKKVKKLEYLSDKEKRTKYGKCDCTEFPNQNKNQNKERLPYIVMSKSESFARDLIRHIRNGIAHGESTVCNVDSELYIEVIDYSDKTKSPEKQTAYLFIPLSYVTQFYKLYDDINKSIMNTTKKDRKLTKKHKQED